MGFRLAGSHRQWTWVLANKGAILSALRRLTTPTSPGWLLKWMTFRATFEAAAVTPPEVAPSNLYCKQAAQQIFIQNKMTTFGESCVLMTDQELPS